MKGEKDAILNYSKRNDCYLCGCEVSGHLNVLIPRVSVFRPVWSEQLQKNTDLSVVSQNSQVLSDSLINKPSEVHIYQDASLQIWGHLPSHV